LHLSVAPATPVTPPATTSPVKITLEIGIQTEPFDQTQDVVDEPAVVKTMSFEVTEKHAAMHVLEEPATSILEQAEPAEQVPVQTTATVVPADSVVVAVADARSEVSTDADHTRSSPVQQLNAENDDQHTWIKQTDPTSGDTYYECLGTCF
jgi:tRNA(Ile2) C34 agmatinyltransferase TiaS